MKFSEQDFAFEAMHQGRLLDYSGYVIKWSTTKDNGFIKFCKPNTSMEDDVRFNIKTGRQIACNSSENTVNKEIVDTVFSILKSLRANVGGKAVSLLDAAVVYINKAHLGDVYWTTVDNEKCTKFILAPKKKGE